jgi:hypothetical protein
MEISLYMSIFEPQFHFLLSLLIWLALIAKITIIERINIKNFLSTAIFGAIFIFAVILYLIPDFLSKEVYLAIQASLIGIVLGLIFRDLFIKSGPDQEIIIDIGNVENKYKQLIEKRKKNIQIKLPVLFGIVCFSIQNNSQSPFLAVLAVVIMLSACLLYLSIKGKFKVSTNYLTGFTLAILFQFLITYNEFVSSINVQAIKMIIWSLALIFLYCYERNYKEESFVQVY